VDPLATQIIEHDRGLGTAYERWCFYQRVEEWARAYGCESALEGPLDGMAGVSGVHLVGLARRGVRVVSAVPSEAKAVLARGVYERAGAAKEAVEVRVVEDPMRAGEALAPADLVVAYHSVPLVSDWRRYLAMVGSLARKVLVVTVCNPDNWGVAAIRAAARLRGRSDMEAPESWKTDVLAPELWQLGRVRDHVYFDAPWWPDLQVAPGQSLIDRAKQLVSRRRSLRFTATEAGAVLAERFVYGTERWPYFGGEGWTSELLPALLRHPGFDGSKGRWAARVAHLHAFVVDRTPRSPQARRRLAQAG
jgi:hypothetical protein